MIEKNVLVDVIQTVIDAVRADSSSFDSTFDASFRDEVPYYMYGHPLEIETRLKAKDASKTAKYQKYPLIALKLDYEEDIFDGMYHYDMNIALISSTNAGYWAPERQQKIFKAILYPMYEKFLEKLKSVGKFTWEGDQRYPPHKKYDRYYYGTKGDQQNVKNIFTDPLDAIEILNMRINRRVIC